MIAYLPLLLTQPGWVGADTKTYLYLDPAKLLADAPWSWDSQIGMGTVTHQNIGYLFPMGPFYLLCDLLRLPDWLAQRLWLGTLMFLAALGVRHLARTIDLGLGEGGVLVASLAYMLSPYLLDYSARISVILLPWVALPWLVALTARCVRNPGWRDPALFALVVLAVGGINATALLMIGVAPLLWVVHAVLITREATARSAVAAVGRIGALTLVTSLWWMGGLWAEGRYGLPVIRYTETYRAVAGSSNAPEVLRGLGYWFFYGNDKLGPWVEPSDQYTTNLPLLALSYGLPTAGLALAAVTRWRHRGYFLLLLSLGALVAVAGHPWEGPSVLGSIFKELTRTNAGLSLRSTPRAVPMVALATAVFLATGATALGRRLPGRARVVPIGLACALIVANMPTLWLGQMVAKYLRRPEEVPAYWREAARWLDGRPHDTRALEAPGIEFAAYRWGNTVDPVTPGLMTRPYLARELFQWGSPQSAALLNAVDRRIQEGIAEPESIVPILELLGVGDLVDRNDLQYERFRTARPKQVWDLLRRTPGLEPPIAFTPVTPNVAGPEVTLTDELELGQPLDLPDAPAVSAFALSEPQPIIRTQPDVRPLLMSGDAEGLVDAAAMGLVHPDQPVFFAGSFANDPAALAALASRADVLITDSNRKRAQRWGALRENTGYTERAGETPRVYDPGDQRLEVFPGATDRNFTVSEQQGNAVVTATGYGNPITFTPDDRATNAFDGDPQTAWRVGAIDSPIGERLVIELAAPATADHITLVQPLNNVRNRWITTVRVHFDEGPPVDAELGLESRVEPGQTISFGTRTFQRLEIEVTADDIGPRPRYDGQSGVGFSEVRVPGVQVREAIRPPVDLLEALGDSGAPEPGGNFSLLFDRMRSNPAEPVRTDEEPRMNRTITLPSARRFTVAGTARLSPWAPDNVIDRLLGLPDASEGGLTAVSSAFIPSSLDQRAAAAVDGDPSTHWTSIYDRQEGFWLKYDLPSPITFDHLDLAVLNDGVHSVPTRLRLEADGGAPVYVDIPAIADTTTRGSVAQVRVDVAPLSARSLRVVVDAAREVTTLDWYTNKPIATPIAIAELGIDGLRSPAPGKTFDSGCRDDLLMIDGTPVPLRITGTTDDALGRSGLSVDHCPAGDGATGPVAVELSAGPHVIRTALGRELGLDLDRLLFSSGSGTAPQRGDPATASTPALTVLDQGRTTYRVQTGAAPTSYWLTLGQSWSTGWRAVTSTGTDLGPPVVINGYGNGWRVDPGVVGSGPLEISLEWMPQRVVWWGVWVSVVGVVACLAVACFGSRRPSRAHGPATASRPPEVALPWRASDPLGAKAGLLLVLAGAVFIALNLPAAPARILVALVLVTAVALTARATKGRGWLGLVASASLGAAGAFTVIQQYRRRYPADFVWPQLFDRVHILGVVAILLTGLEGLRAWLAERAERGHEPVGCASDPPAQAPTI